MCWIFGVAGSRNLWEENQIREGQIPYIPAGPESVRNSFSLAASIGLRHRTDLPSDHIAGAQRRYR